MQNTSYASVGSVMDDVSVDLAEISTRTRELAAKMGTQAPDVQSGSVPSWVAEGLRVLPKRGRTVLRVGPAFGELSESEQNSVLASTLVVADLYRRGSWKPLAVSAIALVLALPADFIAGLQGIPAWPAILGTLAICGISYVVAYMIWGRQLTYQHDRRLTELMGRGVMEVLLGLDARKRRELEGWPLVVVTLACPPESRRAERLDALAGQPRQSA